MQPSKRTTIQGSKERPSVGLQIEASKPLLYERLLGKTRTLRLVWQLWGYCKDSLERRKDPSTGGGYQRGPQSAGELESRREETGSEGQGCGVCG